VESLIGLVLFVLGTAFGPLTSLLYYLHHLPLCFRLFIVQVSNSLGLCINMQTILVYRPSPEFPTVELAVSKHPTSVPCILYRDF